MAGPSEFESSEKSCVRFGVCTLDQQ
jgi:hypothetical protein